MKSKVKEIRGHKVGPVMSHKFYPLFLFSLQWWPNRSKNINFLISIQLLITAVRGPSLYWVTCPIFLIWFRMRFLKLLSFVVSLFKWFAELCCQENQENWQNSAILVRKTTILSWLSWQTWSLEGIVLDQTWNSVNEKTIEIIFNL